MSIFTLNDLSDHTKMLFTCLIVILVYLFVTYYQNVKTSVRIWLAVRKLPGPPKAHWWHGHSPLMTCNEKFLMWLRSLWKHGKVMTFYMGRHPMVMALHPDTAKVFLSKVDSKDSLINQLGKDFIGDGLASTKGEKWRRNRKLLTPAFHLSTLRGYVPIMQSCVEAHIGKWANSSAADKSLNVSDEINHLTMDCLLSCAFGEDILSKSQISKIRELTEELAGLWMGRMTYIPYQYDCIYRLTSAGKRFYSNIKEVNSLTKLVIDNSRKTIASGLSENKTLSFVDIILRAKDEDGKGMTDQELMDEINTFTFAGHHTIASAIPYCLHYLAKYPEIQERCRSEMREAMGSDTTLSWEHLLKMPYLTMFIKESLRMAGPFNLTHKTLEQDMIVEGHTIPKGCSVGVMIETVHHHPEIWPHPDRFDPERFSAENAEMRHPFAFLEFAAGIRNCIGQVFAMTEIRVMIVCTLLRFRLRLDTQRPLVMTFPFMRKTRDGVWLHMDHV